MLRLLCPCKIISLSMRDPSLGSFSMDDARSTRLRPILFGFHWINGQPFSPPGLLPAGNLPPTRGSSFLLFQPCFSPLFAHLHSAAQLARRGEARWRRNRGDKVSK